VLRIEGWHRFLAGFEKLFVMEQQLINQLICFIRKSGGESFIKNLLSEVDQNVNDRVWTEEEIVNAVNHLNWVNDFFGKSDATIVISNLLQLYRVDIEDLSLKPLS
jgi:hypothetical protein